MTIIDAVLSVLKTTGKAMTPREVLEEIQMRKLYEFKTKDPLSVVRTQMNRHSRGYRRQLVMSKIVLERLENDMFKAI